MKSPLPGGTLLVGRPNRVEIAPYAEGVDELECTLWRGDTQITTEQTRQGQTKTCNLGTLNVVMIGDAELAVRGRVYNEKTAAVLWGPPARVNVTIAAATPKPGSTPEWNGHYKTSTTAYFYTEDLTIRNGTLTATLKSKDFNMGGTDKNIFTFAPFQLKVDPDGTIVPQQVALTIAQRPERSSPVEDQYLAAAKTIWVYGSAHLSSRGSRVTTLFFQGPPVKIQYGGGATEDLTWSQEVGYSRD